MLDKRVCEGKQIGLDTGEELKDLLRGGGGQLCPSLAEKVRALPLSPL